MELKEDKGSIGRGERERERERCEEPTQCAPSCDERESRKPSTEAIRCAREREGEREFAFVKGARSPACLGLVA